MSAGDSGPADAAAPPDAVRDAYGRLGVDGYYRLHAADYRNPHEDGVLAAFGRHAAHLDLSRVLDLGCGSGEITLAVRALGGRAEGVDPYTGAAYLARTGQRAEPWSFADVAAGALAGRRYSAVVASYALHLCEESRLPGLEWALAALAPALLVLSPHKRPRLRHAWRLVAEDVDPVDRVRARRYRSDAGGG